MSDYEIRWITDDLAVGHAPMSYRDLETIREQGISVIINLCGEYCDLHEIEENYGFEVLYLPIPDDDAPNLEQLDRALDWLDEAIYLGKKALVHCRFGIGRTGTLVTSYLLRCGFGLKSAKKRLKPVRSNPTSFRQWRLLRKYRKQERQLTIREPSLEGKHVLDLAPYFQEYEILLQEADRFHSHAGGSEPPRCGKDTDRCCRRPLFLQFIEAAYLSHFLNRKTKRSDRLAAIQRAVQAGHRLAGDRQNEASPARDAANATHDYLCPLNVDGKCLLYSHRPVNCRLHGAVGDQPGSAPAKAFSIEEINRMLAEISQNLFFALNGAFLEKQSLLFPLPHVVSGKFVQDYFTYLKQQSGIEYQDLIIPNHDQPK